jgi:hypothetical protein
MSSRLRETRPDTRPDSAVPANHPNPPWPKKHSNGPSRM